MPAPSIERNLSVEKKGNKYNRGEDQQFDMVWYGMVLAYAFMLIHMLQ